jgi:hypothetical protein
MDVLAHSHTFSRSVAKLGTCNTCVSTERTNLTARRTNDVDSRNWTGFSRDDANSEGTASHIGVLSLTFSTHLSLWCQSQWRRQNTTFSHLRGLKTVSHTVSPYRLLKANFQFSLLLRWGTIIYLAELQLLMGPVTIRR